MNGIAKTVNTPQSVTKGGKRRRSSRRCRTKKCRSSRRRSTRRRR